MNWMPVLPDELFSHRAPRAPSAPARAPAQGSTFFSCLFPAPSCFQPWHHPPASPVSREGWSWGAALLFGAALLSGPSSCSTVGVGRERVADVCSVLLPSLAPGWGRGRGLSWATPAVALWGQGVGPEAPWPRRALRPACASPRPCGQAGPHKH